MRKFTLALALFTSLAGLVVFGSAVAVAKPAAAKPASTKLSIRSYPGGVFGYVTSPAAATCASDRKVVVYEQVGAKRDPQSDPRISVDLAEASESSFLWTVATKKSGEFYARVAPIKGCGEALSATVESRTLALEAAGTNAGYPTCGPYVSEGPSEICNLGQLYLSLEEEGFYNACGFGSSSGNCSGSAFDAPYPWGARTSASSARARVYWRPGTSARALTVVSFPGSSPDGNGSAHLGGTVPGPSSDRFTVTDGFAQNEAGYPNGDHFFTPDLPGQAAGEVGGPLKLNWKNGSGTDFGAQAWITGYLYLKR